MCKPDARHFAGPGPENAPALVSEDDRLTTNAAPHPPTFSEQPAEEDALAHARLSVVLLDRLVSIDGHRTAQAMRRRDSRELRPRPPRGARRAAAANRRALDKERPPEDACSASFSHRPILLIGWDERRLWPAPAQPLLTCGFDRGATVNHRDQPQYWSFTPTLWSSWRRQTVEG